MNKFFSIIFIFFLIMQPALAYMEDFMADTIVDPKSPSTYTDYDYFSTKMVPIDLQIVETISTRDKSLHEGKIVKLKATRPVFLDGKMIVAKDEVGYARVGLIISSGMNGIPYQIVLSDFEIQNIEPNLLLADYTKGGFNRTYFVLPLKWALTFLPPTGSLTNFIKGGHAKITPKDKITIFYYPEWKK